MKVKIFNKKVYIFRLSNVLRLLIIEMQIKCTAILDTIDNVVNSYFLIILNVNSHPFILSYANRE